MATKVKILGVKKVAASVARGINKAIADNNIYKDAHELLEKEIRIGKNPKTGRAYKKLAPSTVENRRRLAKTNSTHTSYAANRSNLTLTGKLLEGLFSRFNKSKGILTVDVKGQHPGYKGQKKKIKGSSKSRKEIVDHLESQGRFVLQTSDKFIQRLVKRIEKSLRRL